METWQATIKEAGTGNLLTPTWSGSGFEYIADERLRDQVTRKYLREFWGLDKDDVEWYQLEKIENDE